MPWVLIPIAIAGALLFKAIEDSSQKELHNCHDLFISFDKKISISKAQKKSIEDVRKRVEAKIKELFQNKKNIQFRGFYIQGSLSKSFQTTVIRRDGTYDIDIGVYLWKKPLVSCTTVQKYVYTVFENHTEGGAKHLEKCVRIIYAGNFDIDLPIYYQEKENSEPFIAIKNGDWRKDDPKGISKWFSQKNKASNGQLRRIIKYLKIWADKDRMGFRPPSGFALTIWAANNFVAVENRDDLSFFETIKKINASITTALECKCPIEPFDDLTSNLNATQKIKFKAALQEFVVTGQEASNYVDKDKVVQFWRTHFGEKFSF